MTAISKPPHRRPASVGPPLYLCRRRCADESPPRRPAVQATPWSASRSEFDAGGSRSSGLYLHFTDRRVLSDVLSSPAACVSMTWEWSRDAFASGRCCRSTCAGPRGVHDGFTMPRTSGRPVRRRRDERCVSRCSAALVLAEGSERVVLAEVRRLESPGPVLSGLCSPPGRRSLERVEHRGDGGPPAASASRLVPSSAWSGARSPGGWRACSWPSPYGRREGHGTRPRPSRRLARVGRHSVRRPSLLVGASAARSVQVRPTTRPGYARFDGAGGRCVT
jgi:hypothetical protein